MKHKRVVVIAVLMSMTASVSMAANSKIYENKEMGIRAAYPSGWHRADNESGALVMFISPEQKAGDAFPEYVGLYVRHMTAPVTTLESYTVLSEKEVNQDPNATLIDSIPAKLSGMPGHQMTGVTKSGELDLQWLQVWAVKGDKVYMCTYVADKKSYKHFLSAAEKIIASFKIV